MTGWLGNNFQHIYNVNRDHRIKQIVTIIQNNFPLNMTGRVKHLKADLL